MSEQKKLKVTINANGNEISVVSSGDENDFISITDIAKYKSEDPTATIQNWMRNKDTIEFLGLWESMFNSNFKPIEFEGFKIQSGANAFTMSPKKWISSTNAIGIVSKSGRYGGTYAHKDIAFEFASWISAEFKLYIIKDYQRLKDDENSKLSLPWNINRVISKINYRIHTDAIKENLIPQIVTKMQQGITYAIEADILNVAMFGITAKEWRVTNRDEKGNIRDCASLQQLIVLSNLESMNAELIKRGLPQSERLIQLNKMAIEQLSVIMNSTSMKKLECLRDKGLK